MLEPEIMLGSGEVRIMVSVELRQYNGEVGFGVNVEKANRDPGRTFHGAVRSIRRLPAGRASIS